MGLKKASRHQSGLSHTLGSIGHAIGSAASQGAGLGGHTQHLSPKEKIVNDAAAKEDIPPDLLWGVWGVETNWGMGQAVSSAGAKGPFQFMPATARALHLLHPNNPRESAFAAAKYLKSLGINDNVNNALNRYNGNGGGNSDTSYSSAVKEKAKTYKGPHNATGSGGAGGIGPAGALVDDAKGAADAVGSGLDAIGAIAEVIINPTKLGELLAGGVAIFFKFIGKATYKYVIQPPWHWSQRAVIYYFEVQMDDGTKALLTLAFWATGYAILFAKVEDDPSLTAKPGQTPLGRTLGTFRDLSKRPKLKAPQKVKKETTSKPEPTHTAVPVARIRYVSASRRRAVTVTEKSPENGRENFRETDRESVRRETTDNPSSVTTSTGQRQRVQAQAQAANGGQAGVRTPRSSGPPATGGSQQGGGRPRGSGGRRSATRTRG